MINTHFKSGICQDIFSNIYIISGMNFKQYVKLEEKYFKFTHFGFITF